PPTLGAQDLRAAQAEDRSAHVPENRRPQFEPDHEEHHDHAELRDVHYILTFGLYQSEAEWADHDSREQISQDRPEPEPLCQGHGNGGRQQIDERLGKSHEASRWLSMREENYSSHPICLLS